MQDLTNIVSIAIHWARKRGEFPIRTEEQAAVLRGFIAWKISNKAKMQARDEAKRAERKAKRQKS